MIPECVCHRCHRVLKQGEILTDSEQSLLDRICEGDIHPADTRMIDLRIATISHFFYLSICSLLPPSVVQRGRLSISGPKGGSGGDCDQGLVRGGVALLGGSHHNGLVRGWAEWPTQGGLVDDQGGSCDASDGRGLQYRPDQVCSHLGKEDLRLCNIKSLS